MRRPDKQIVNRIIVSGKIAAAPSVFHNRRGIPFALLSVFTEGEYSDTRGDTHKIATAHNICVYGDAGREVAENFKKGDWVMVHGALYNRNDKTWILAEKIMIYR